MGPSILRSTSLGAVPRRCRVGRVFVVGGRAMPIAFYGRHFHTGAHRRFWLMLAAVIAFLLAVLWAKPIG